MVHERAKVHGDEDGINQVGEHDGESSRQPVQLARVNLEGIKVRREVKHASSLVVCLGLPQNQRVSHVVRWRAREFDQFGLKTGGDMFDRFESQN